MKTIKEMTAEISSMQSKLGNPESKSAAKEIYLLRQYISYIQAGAKEKYLKKDLEVLERRLDIIEKGYGKWLSCNMEYNQLENPETKYNSIMETKKVRGQIKAIKYLLQI